jgi:hypothetical protein
MSKAVKAVSKRDAGIPVVATFQLAADADSEEEDTSEAQSEGDMPVNIGVAPVTAPPGAPPAPGQAPAAAAGQGGVAGIQKALKKLGFDPGALDGVSGPKTKAAIQKFQQANGLAADGIAGPKTQAALAKALAGAAAPPAAPPAPPGPAAGDSKLLPGARPANLSAWQAARQEAINDLKALATKVAATKHADAAGVVKEISSVIARLPASPAPNAIDQLEAFITQDESITAAEQSPKHFHDLNIRKPLLAALESLKQ